MSSGIYKKLDSLQFEALSKIRKIVSALDISVIEEEYSFEVQRQNLAHEVFIAISEFKNLLETARVMEEEQDSPSVQYQVYCDKLLDLKLRLRQAQIQSTEAANEIIHRQRLAQFCADPITTNTKTEDEIRNELFGKRLATGVNSSLTAQNQLLNKNKSITASLQATRQMMSTSIMHTELNIDTIDQQLKDLSQLNDKFTDFNEVLNKSRAIVKFIQKQDRSDKNRIYMSLGFLALVSFWVVWRRILKVPVYFMLWSFFKIFRIFNWMVGSTATSNNMVDVSPIASVVVSATTTATSIASLAAASVLSVSTAMTSAPESDGIVMDKEYTMDIEVDQVHLTWEEIVSEEIKKIELVEPNSIENENEHEHNQEVDNRIVDEL